MLLKVISSLASAVFKIEKTESNGPRTKMLLRHTHFQKNYDLPLWGGQAVKKKLPFFYARANYT